MFADDFVLFYSNANREGVQCYLNKILTYFSIATRDRTIPVNTSKSKNCVFTINNNLRTFRPSVVLIYEMLNFHENLKYLGVISDLSLCSHKYFDFITTREKKRLNILKYISRKKVSASAETLKITYTGLLRFQNRLTINF